MSEKILIIDDEQDIADLLEVYLKNENYVVYKFYCATDAKAAFTSLEFTMITCRTSGIPVPGHDHQGGPLLPRDS